MSPRITQAVILAAGQGLRLRQHEHDFLKPLYPFHGRPLISYAMENLARNGVTHFYVVVGFHKEELVPGLSTALPKGTELICVDNPDWALSNGISLLKAKGHVQGRFYLTMSDHLFDPAMVQLLGERAERADTLYLAVDHKLDTIFDMDDATKVRVEDGRIAEIGKELAEFSAVDTGLFVCPPEVFSHLSEAKVNGNCSLSDGVRSMARAGLARVVDIGPLCWQDVDTPEMFQHADSLVARLFGKP